ELAEPELARDRGRLVRHALHQVAVGADHVDAVVDEAVVRPVERVAEEALGERHPDAVRKPLPERPGRGLDARRVAVLRMPRRRRAPLPEAPQLLEREGVAGEEQRALLQEAGVADAGAETVCSTPRTRAPPQPPAPRASAR